MEEEKVTQMIKQQPLSNNKEVFWIRGSRGLTFPVHIFSTDGPVIHWGTPDGCQTGTCHRSDLIDELGLVAVA